MSRLSRKKKLGFGVLVSALLLLGAELGLRALGIPEERALLTGLAFPPPDAWGVSFEPDPARHWRLKPGNDQPWGLFKVQYTYERDAPVDAAARVAEFPERDYYTTVRWGVNDQGFRGAPHDPAKPLVLFLGSSFTFGWGVQSADAFPGRVRARLGEGWDVVNAGVPGYSSYQSRVQLEGLLETLKPRVVVVDVGINDGVWAPGGGDAERRGAPAAGALGALVGRSSLLLTLSLTVNGRRGDPGDPAARFFTSSLSSPNRVRVTEAELRENLDAMTRQAAQVGARFYVIVPSLYNEYGQRALLPAARLKRLDGIDLTGLLRARGEPARFFLPYDEAHLSPEGHRVLAEGVWERLVADGVTR